MTDLAPIESGPLTLFGWATPRQVVQQATDIANEIAPLIRDRQLVKRIHQSEHVYLEGWTLAGTMLGVFATTARTWEIGSDEGYGATAETRTLAGAVVGRADAVVMRNEEVGVDPKTGKPIRKWERAPAFQLLSMAQTRASSKALRMPLGFIMKLAGYDTTPAEEMEAAAARGETVSGGKGVAPGWRDLAEQQRAFADFAEAVDRAGRREWAAKWIDSKGYQRPLAKGQFRQLQRAYEREQDSGRPAGDDADPGRPAGTNVPGAAAAGGAGDPTSPPAQATPGKGGQAGGDDPEGGDADG